MSKIQFEQVSFSFSKSGKNRLIHDLSVSFDSGKITVLTGPSGCGKSTILNLAAGIYPQNADVLYQGRILVSEQDIGKLPPDKRAPLIGVMFQNPDLQFCMDTVENELLFCLGNLNTPREKMMDIVNDALEFCGILHLRNRLLQSLSGGEKQKAMLACMVAIKPKWMLLDEPFANVDEQSAGELIKKIAALHKSGTGILVVDHRLDYWLPFADEIRLMDALNGVKEKAFRPEDLTDEQLLEMGILPPNIRYKKEKSAHISEGKEMPILELQNLQVTRGDNSVLNRISYRFVPKKTYAILGSSGSGKSTLFGAMTQLYKYDGEILVEGKNAIKRAVRKSGTVGFVTQNPQDQFVADTVLEEVTIGLQRRKRSVSEAESILREIDLWGYRNFSPYMLSQGQQRRLGVAALMTYDCRVLICDEPTYAQDWKNTVAIMDSLVDKTKAREMTLIFSTHDRKLAFDYADVILVLEEGKLIEFTQSRMQNDWNFNSYANTSSGT